MECPSESVCIEKSSKKVNSSVIETAVMIQDAWDL